MGTLSAHRNVRPARERLAVWAEQHWQAAKGAALGMRRSALATPLTVAVIGIALVLPAALALMVSNARVASAGMDAALDVSVYLKLRLSDSQGESARARIAARVDVQSARYVSPEQGLAEFRRWSGLGPALDALGRNPLPAAIVIRPKAHEGDPAAIDRLVEDLRALPEVEEVRFDGLWVRRYTSLLDALARLAELLGGLLALAVLLIIGNTVRLNVDSRRHEIDVLKRVGAEDAFVRRPFLYGGVWHGALGGLASLGLLDALVLLARGPVGRVAAAYGSSYQLSLPSAGLAALLVGGGALLGWVGAYAASHRQLRLMDPSEDDPVGRQR